VGIKRKAQNTSSALSNILRGYKFQLKN
jgi:hypothetical protein